VSVAMPLLRLSPLLETTSCRVIPIYIIARESPQQTVHISVSMKQWLSTKILLAIRWRALPWYIPTPHILISIELLIIRTELFNSAVSVVLIFSDCLPVNLFRYSYQSLSLMWWSSEVVIVSSSCASATMCLNRFWPICLGTSALVIYYQDL